MQRGVGSDGPGRQDAFMPAYNLFQRRLDPSLYCAVPEDRTVPSFVMDEQWRFWGKVDKASAAPAGFRERAASLGTKVNGFHLFQSVRA